MKADNRRNLTGWIIVAARAHKFRDFRMNSKREERKRAAIEKQIDENLRRVYEQDTREDVPDRFLMLLAQLREQE